LCAEYTANKDGGNITQVTPDPVVKSKEEDILHKSLETPGFDISQLADELVKSLDGKFSSLSTILKHSLDRNTELQKSLDEIRTSTTASMPGE
jgi:hypothetical protein